ncbi:hypothetical protein JM66_13630 [Aeromonas bestiarum]|nr:hypothetical protein JM66_13630 [Aeromonas bestiarum]
MHNLTGLKPSGCISMWFLIFLQSQNITLEGPFYRLSAQFKVEPCAANIIAIINRRFDGHTLATT